MGNSGPQNYLYEGGGQPNILASSLIRNPPEQQQGNPTLDFITSLLPGIGQLQSAGDAIASGSQGNYGDAAMNLLGTVIPIHVLKDLRLSKMASKFPEMSGEGYQYRMLEKVKDYLNINGHEAKIGYSAFPKEPSVIVKIPSNDEWGHTWTDIKDMEHATRFVNSRHK